MRYKNPHAQNLRRSLVDVILWKTGYYTSSKRPKMPEGFEYPREKRAVRGDRPQVTWIGHCTFLTRVFGVNVLTDPVFGERCSPVPFFGPKRRHKPGLSLSKLPKIDVVLISHNHYDHLEKKTVRALNKRYPKIVWYVPEGVKKWFVRQGVKHVVELKWWERSELKVKGVQMQLRAVPSQHFSGRHPMDYNKSLWVGWVAGFTKGSAKKQLYFTGDTGYNGHDFKRIGKEFGAMDLSLIPIGTYEPHDFMQPVHINPKCAVKIHKQVHSKLSIGMHWKTFNLSDEPLDRPPYDLYLEMKRAHLNPKSFLPIQPGETVNW